MPGHRSPTRPKSPVASGRLPARGAMPGGPGDACGACNDGGGLGELIFGPCWGLMQPHDDWVRGDALLWWTKGAHIPALLTTSPDGTPQAQAGVLGQPGTVVLFGEQEVNDDFRAGGRISLGTWLDEADDFGIELTYLALRAKRRSIFHRQHGEPYFGSALF